MMNKISFDKYPHFGCLFKKKLLVIFAQTSDQGIVIVPANKNRNRFAEPTSVRIGIGIVCEFQNLQIGIGMISQIIHKYLIPIFSQKNV